MIVFDFCKNEYYYLQVLMFNLPASCFYFIYCIILCLFI